MGVAVYWEFVCCSLNLGWQPVLLHTEATQTRFYFVSPDRQRRCLTHWISIAHTCRSSVNTNKVTCDLGDVVNVRQHKRPSHPGNALLAIFSCRFRVTAKVWRS